MKIEFGRFSESDIKDGKIFYVYMNYTEGSTTVNWNPSTKNKGWIVFRGNPKDDEKQIANIIGRIKGIFKKKQHDKILINVEHLGNNGALSRLNRTLLKNFNDGITALKQQQQQGQQQQGQQQQHGQHSNTDSNSNTDKHGQQQDNNHNSKHLCNPEDKN